MQICKSEDCTGCYACYNLCRHHAITMEMDRQGFYRPSVSTDACIQCGLCIKKCPANRVVSRNEQPLNVYSGWSLDDNTRLSSASGGAFVEIAKAFIEKTDGVVFGVAMDDQLEARHVQVSTTEEIRKLQGSKYIPSHVDDTYLQVKDLLKKGRYVLFSGTPCQVAGLKSIVGHEVPNLYTIDLICHGVPSERLFKDYIRYVEKRIGHSVRDVKFRCKKSSWIFYNMAINRYVEKNGTVKYEYEGKYFSDPFIRAFLRDNALRSSCYHCQYNSTRRVADFTLADWWGYRAHKESDKDYERKGVNLIFCNTEKAQNLLSIANLDLEERTLEEAKQTNKSLSQPYDVPSTREEFWKDYEKMNFEQMVKKWMDTEKVDPCIYIRYKMKESSCRRFVLTYLKKYIYWTTKSGFGVKKITAD